MQDMAPSKSLPRVIGIAVGSIGIVLCVAALVGIWLVSARLGQATESLFSKMDHSLVVVRQWVVQTQERVSAAAITTNELATALRDWTGREVGQRLAAQLDAAEKTERLASTLRQADQWLEVSESSLELVQELLSIGAPISEPNDTTLIDQIKEELASLRAQLAEATEFTAGIHERITGASEEKSPDARIEQAAQFALRVVATLGSVGPRLERFADRFSSAQSQLQGLNARIQRWRLLVTAGVAVLILWMAAGQIALCRLAWNGLP